MARKNSFPWGLVLLAGGAYLLYQHSKNAAAAPAPAIPAAPSTLPATATAVTALPVTMAQPAALPAVPETPQAAVLRVAQQDGRPNFLYFAQHGDPADIQQMGTLIQTEWDVYGRCHTTACTQFWAYIINKYNIH